MISRNQNLLWMSAFFLIFPVVYVTLWILNKSTEFLLHVYFWDCLFILGFIFYALYHHKYQSMWCTVLWLLAFAMSAFIGDILFDFIRYPMDMSLYLGETIGVSVYYFFKQSLLFGFTAFFIAFFIRRSCKIPNA